MDGVDACYVGAALGLEPRRVVLGDDPELLQANSFFWEMETSGDSVPSRGISWYTRLFSLFEEGYPMGAGTQMGMGGTWLYASGLKYDHCACKGFGSDCCQTLPCDCAWWLAESIEGGPGYWGNQLPTTVPKWRVGDSVGCYSAYTGTPLFQFGNQLPTTVPKWRVGDSVGCYSAYTGTPLFNL